MSGNKGKGFSQTSKRFDGELKSQHQQSRNKQVDHPRHDDIENAAETEQNNRVNPSRKNRS